jgi:hypothetical protein
MEDVDHHNDALHALIPKDTLLDIQTCDML